MADKTATYTVNIPTPKGHTGGVPYSVHTNVGYFKGSIPFGADVPNVPEPVVKVLKEAYPDAVYTPEKTPEKKAPGK